MNKNIIKQILAVAKDTFLDMTCDEVDIPNTPENVEFIVGMMGDDAGWWKAIYEGKLKGNKTLTISMSSAIDYILKNL